MPPTPPRIFATPCMISRMPSVSRSTSLPMSSVWNALIPALLLGCSFGLRDHVDLAAARGFERAALLVRAAQPRGADEAGELVVGARERAQQAGVDGVQQAYCGARVAAVEPQELGGGKREQAGRFAHPRRGVVRRSVEHREVADQLARPGQGNASLHPVF